MEQLQRLDGGLLYTPGPPNVNILHHYGNIVLTKKLTLVQYC